MPRRARGRSNIDPRVARDFVEKIAQVLLGFVPGLEVPDATDRKDARSLSLLLTRFDLATIQKLGAWLFSDEGWPDERLTTGSGVRVKNPGEPSNELLGRLRAVLRNTNDVDA